MKLKKYIIYLIVLVLLAGYYGYFEVYRKEKNEKLAEQNKKVFSLNVADVDQVKMVRKDDKPIVLVREKNKEWTITEPLNKKADKMEVEELVGYLKKLERQMVISEKATDLVQYGLDHPSLSISFHTKDGWREIEFGSVNPVGKDYYAKTKDKPQVFVVASSTHKVLNKDLFKLRDKSLFTLQSSDVNGLDIEKGALTVRFDKAPGEKGKWSLEGDKQFRVKKSKVEGIIRQFAWLRASAFEQENDKDLAKFGLDKPAARVTMKKGDHAETLLLGSEHVKGRIYAKLAGKPGVVSIKSQLLKEIPGSVSDFMDRTILSFDEDQVSKVLWKTGDKESELVKKDGKWSWVLPKEMKDKKIEAWAIEGALWKLKDLEYASEAKETDKPSGGETWSVTVFGDKGKQAANLLVLGNGAGEQKDQALTKVEGNELTGAYWVNQTPLNEAKKSFKTLGEEKK